MLGAGEWVGGGGVGELWMLEHCVVWSGRFGVDMNRQARHAVIVSTCGFNSFGLVWYSSPSTHLHAESPSIHPVLNS